MSKQAKKLVAVTKTAEPQVTKTQIVNTENKPIILWVAIVILSVMLIASFVMIALLVVRGNNDSLLDGREDQIIQDEEQSEEENEKTHTDEDGTEEVDNSEDTSNDNASEDNGQNSQDDGGLQVDPGLIGHLEVEFDPGVIEQIVGWSTYTNAEHKYSLQYPKDLTYVETNTPNSDQTVFKSGDTVVFIVRVEYGDNIDNFLADMITNQCTDFITYYDVTKNNIDYRRALEDPNQGCLDAHGIVRDNDLEAFGVDFTNIFFGISSQKLNPSQFNQVLESVKFSNV